MLLFIHGSGFTGDVFSQQLPAFPGSIAPNLPGHPSRGSGSTVAEFSDFIEHFISEHKLNEVTLCGNSLGGAVALDVALRKNPKVRSIVLLGSGARLRVAPQIIEGLRHDFETTSREIAEIFYAEPTSQQISYTMAAMHHVGQAQTIADYEACNAFDVMERLNEISVPVLAITGEQDRMTPPKYAHFLANRVPKGQVRIVPGAGHLVMAEKPTETNEAIAEFLTSGHDAGGASIPRQARDRLSSA